MKKKYLLEDDGAFILKNYNSAHPFSNFLPGISGEWGIPLWVFYVNRGQGVVSFGIKDKNHAISEFFPANKAYAFVSSIGFRTFIKINKGAYHEPFKSFINHKRKEEMIIRSASLEIKEDNPEAGLNFSVKYFTLPNTSVGGLVRKVTIKNISNEDINLEVLDGLSRIIPFGAANYFLKDMSRTLEAWMHSSIENNLAAFRLIVSPQDVSKTSYIEGANFNSSFYEYKGKKISPYLIVDPAVIFGEDLSYSLPIKFLNKNFKTPVSQITLGKTPCAFSYFKWNLPPYKEHTFYSVFGSSFNLKAIKKFSQSLNKNFLKNKEVENEKIIERIKDNALCVSALKNFDNYVKTTYLDNVLRGGYPYRVKKADNHQLESEKSKGIYYIFSRKHGDLERDYNHFQLLPSYFSEGQANYRDINQNRRMDLFFEPFVGAKNIIYFFNFLKIDGYNPLVVKGGKLRFKKAEAQSILKKFGIKNQELIHLMVEGFYLGEFFNFLGEQLSLQKKENLLLLLLEKAQFDPQAHHGEGYWVDHWHYNLDLIENFLYFYPDKLKDLFLHKVFSFWDDEHYVLSRGHRYVLRGGKVYQDESLKVVEDKKKLINSRSVFKNLLRTKKGTIYKTTLLCKLLTLLLNKSATLDACGIGIEMEAGKPGWCDSLNGLPALFGSSAAETFELKRLGLIMLNAIEHLRKKGICDVCVPYEVFLFFDKLKVVLNKFFSLSSKERDYFWWDRANNIKEDFRKKTFFNLQGDEKKISLKAIRRFVEALITKLNIGINKAKDKKTGLFFTYFTYTVAKYHTKNKKIIPRAFIKKSLPLHLEGIMQALRVEGKKEIYFNLKKSKLFDKKLKMYRLNTSLKGEPLEIGRSRIFAPGWLENESIWLHMEYKYLLELLKKGFYEEFFDDFYKCIVCFFDAEKYGRSILENSSFIVSSAYVDSSLWGRGFVARLSGATAEFLNIWILLCLGKKPFYLDNSEELCINLSPILPKSLFTLKEKIINFKGKKVTLEKNTFSFKLFSQILISYHNPKRKDTFKKDCFVEKIVVTASDGRTFNFLKTITSPVSLMVRDRQVERIDVYLG